ncbi:protein IQ-DOMAIN 31-like [Populus alba x Populus x berolinensis]|uniref:Protein IQ-DOMAIN 31-like n=1 Tax=Populus alba x Populus x berolinensis TaxID=444605 RepID=A0AAD6LWY3_9ROSI|nr:protein IQ-DOMAIN 31-like [Populus alba x Populus x berolinensis]
MSPSTQRRRQHQLQLQIIRGDGAFGKSAKKERVYRGRRSLDSIITTPYLAQRSSFALPTTEAIKKVVAQTHAVERIGWAVEDAAAFNLSFARKALCALRGLVKLQALVRGHQVRKQTTATLRRMHTLMTIQARARCHRVQMAGRITTTCHEKKIIKTTEQEHLYKEFSFARTNTGSHNWFAPFQNHPGRASPPYRERPDYVDTLSNQFFIPTKLHGRHRNLPRLKSGHKAKRETAT